MRNNKQYFFYCVKEGIFVFDVFDYIEEILADTVDYCVDWGLIKENKISCKKKILKEYIEGCIVIAVNEIKRKISKNKTSVLCFYQEKESLNVWSSYFEDPKQIVKTTKQILKKSLPNFIEAKSNERLFKDINGTFQGIPCVLPTGEDEEFITKNKKKWFNPIDKYIVSG